MNLRGTCIASALVCIAALGAIPAGAATYRVDDAATLPRESTALLRWRQIAPTRARDDTLQGAVAVAVRLDLARWVGHTGNLYLVLPAQGTVPVEVSWTTQGRLLPGRISAGQRVLVYSGPITTPVLQETLVLNIEADGNHLDGMQRLDFHFEIDTD